MKSRPIPEKDAYSSVFEYIDSSKNKFPRELSIVEDQF